MGVSKIAAGFLVVVLLVLLLQASRSEFIEPRPPPAPGQECEGQPIVVNYPYQGGLLAPHACRVQCEDNVQRYIVYTNDMATQCDKPPSCLDWGEDKGVTCKPKEE